MNAKIKKNLLSACLIPALCSLPLAIFAQGLKAGDPVGDIAIGTIINDPHSLKTLSDIPGKITVVDFFGTWCVPCLKALPRLQELKNDFKEDLGIVLVSNETEAQLNRFITKRTDFAFPVIVDKDNTWNGLFQPPSLPYTVIVKDGQVLSITTAEKITPEAVKAWLQATPAQSSPSAMPSKKSTPVMANTKSSNELVRLSQDFIYAAKTGDPVAALKTSLAGISFQQLATSLKDDKDKKAFWINLYNGYTQAALKANPDLYRKRGAFFRKKDIVIAGQRFSLDDIEHDILRRSKIKWSLGHLSKLFPSKREKQLRVDKLDWRIHFALNCGAKSCPPIAYYNDETIDAQLDLATRAYLTGEAEYDSARNIIYLPRLMGWFRADFGGKKGMRKILEKYEILPAGAKPKIKFKDYDWTLTVDNEPAVIK